MMTGPRSRPASPQANAMMVRRRYGMASHTALFTYSSNSAAGLGRPEAMAAAIAPSGSYAVVAPRSTCEAAQNSALTDVRPRR